MDPRRTSDRWVTPGVIVALIFTAGAITLSVFAAVTYLTVRGFDPAPVVELVGTLVAASTGCVTLLLQVASRRGVAKVERNTGLQGSEQAAVRDELGAVREEVAAVADYLRPGSHAYPDTTYQTGRSLPPVPDNGTAPAATGRLGA
jgi:hypothetical protein